LAVAGGSGAYSVRFYEHGNVGVALFLIVAFLFFALGIGVNFWQINKIKMKIERGKHG